MGKVTTADGRQKQGLRNLSHLNWGVELSKLGRNFQVTIYIIPRNGQFVKLTRNLCIAFLSNFHTNCIFYLHLIKSFVCPTFNLGVKFRRVLGSSRGAGSMYLYDKPGCEIQLRKCSVVTVSIIAPYYISACWGPGLVTAGNCGWRRWHVG